jgi:hypothetical protein
MRMPAAVQMAFETLLPSAQAQGQGGGIQAYRERLERELSLTDAQKASVDAIFAGMRDRFAALRDMEPEERRTASEKLRREMRGQVEKLLDPTQKKTFLAINAEIDARRAAAQAGSAGGTSGAGASGAAAASAVAAAATASAAAAASAPSAGAAKTSPPAAGSPPAAAPPDGASAKPPSPSSGQTSGSGNAQSGTQGGGQLRAFRERLERDLAFSDAQRTQLDGIFSSMREQFAAVRDAPEAVAQTQAFLARVGFDLEQPMMPPQSLDVRDGRGPTRVLVVGRIDVGYRADRPRRHFRALGATSSGSGVLGLLPPVTSASSRLKRPRKASPKSAGITNSTAEKSRADHTA